MATRTVTLDFPQDGIPQSLRMTALTVDATGTVVPGVTLPSAWALIDAPNGVFRFTFNGDPGTRYAYTAIATYAGVDTDPFTGFVERVQNATPTVTAAEMVTAIRAALLATPVGVVSVTVDGETTVWNRRQAMEELEMWERRVAREAGTRPLFRRVNLSGLC